MLIQFATVRLLRMTAKDLSHHPDQAQHAFIPNPVVNSVGVLSRDQDPLLPQDAQMLGNIALRRANMLYDILNTNLLIAERAENF